MCCDGPKIGTVSALERNMDKTMSYLHR